ncbi:MAG: hypothetical protein BRC24_00500 [Parcubacteria group bacterium SW_4_46_8]|nr:MAG: hypothetical protein BRC24_00500 [Parcubacteria group bacterium SW_4_46_8]
MNTLKKSILSSAIALGLPLLTFAQQVNVNESAFNDIKEFIQDIFNVLAPILLTLIILYILWGAFRFATAGGDEEAREAGKSIMLYGAVGLIVISALLGLLSWLLNLVNVGSGTPNTNVDGFN